MGELGYGESATEDRAGGDGFGDRAVGGLDGVFEGGFGAGLVSGAVDTFHRGVAGAGAETGSDAPCRCCPSGGCWGDGSAKEQESAAASSAEGQGQPGSENCGTFDGFFPRSDE